MKTLEGLDYSIRFVIRIIRWLIVLNVALYISVNLAIVLVLVYIVFKNLLALERARADYILAQVGYTD